MKKHFYTRIAMTCSITFTALMAISILYADHSDDSAQSSDLIAPLHLEKMAQDFVLETKQIEIPGYKTACNPSIARWGNAFLLSFNAYSEDNPAPDRMGLVWLDKDFNVMSTPFILPIKDTWQDARLIAVGNRLYILFNGTIPTGIRRTFIARVHYDGIKLSIDAPECFLDFPGMKEDQGERNWVPFAYGETLMLTYRLVPHQILHPLLGAQKCDDFSCSASFFDWDWGTPRSGTTALLDGDHYLAFFHSSKIMATVHSQEKPIQHYFMGAYTFETHPPFAITAVSPLPIIGKDFYHGPEYKTVRPLLVVFPCGFAYDDKYIWVVYGKQDHEAWVVKLDKKGLYDSLRPIASK